MGDCLEHCDIRAGRIQSSSESSFITPDDGAPHEAVCIDKVDRGLLWNSDVRAVELLNAALITFERWKAIRPRRYRLYLL
jgi:hypothetical protein